MKFDEKRKRKFSHLSDLLYKCWTGAVSIEDVLNRIIGTKDKNYNSYWHAFDEYYDETQKDVEYPMMKRTTRRSSKKMKIDLHCRITMKTTMKRVLC